MAFAGCWYGLYRWRGLSGVYHPTNEPFSHGGRHLVEPASANEVVEFVGVGVEIVEVLFYTVIRSGVVGPVLVRGGYAIFPSSGSHRPANLRLAYLDKDIVGPVVIRSRTDLRKLKESFDRR